MVWLVCGGVSVFIRVYNSKRHLVLSIIPKKSSERNSWGKKKNLAHQLCHYENLRRKSLNRLVLADPSWQLCTFHGSLWIALAESVQSFKKNYGVIFLLLRFIGGWCSSCGQMEQKILRSWFSRRLGQDFSSRDPREGSLKMLHQENMAPSLFGFFFLNICFAGI